MVLSRRLLNIYFIYSIIVNEISIGWYFELLSVNLLDIYNFFYVSSMIVVVFIGIVLRMY